jgi:hypothetical protein
MRFLIGILLLLFALFSLNLADKRINLILCNLKNDVFKMFLFETASLCASREINAVLSFIR